MSRLLYGAQESIVRGLRDRSRFLEIDRTGGMTNLQMDMLSLLISNCTLMINFAENITKIYNKIKLKFTQAAITFNFGIFVSFRDVFSTDGNPIVF